MTAVDDAPVHGAPARAGRAEWLGLAVLALPVFIVAIDLFVLLLALPKIAVDLRAGANQQLWITDIYGFVLAAFLVAMGTLGDRIGRRKLLLIGVVAFGVGSVACAYSTNADMLIVSRAVLGIAGATLMPSSMGLISTLFRDAKQMATAFGIFSSAFTLGAVLGPVIGGFMLAHFWWGSVFLLNVPIMLVLVLVGPKLLPEARNPKAGRLDAISVVLLLVALLPIIYGVTEMARYGPQTLSIVSLAVGLVFGGMFLRRQRRLAHPLLDLGLLRHKVIGAALTGMLSYSSFGGGIMMLMLVYFQLVAGMSTIQAGVAMVPGMITGAIGFQVWAKLATRFRPAYVIAFGLLGAAVGFGLMIQFSPGSGSTVLITGFAIASFFGVAMRGLGSNLVVASAPPQQASSAGSLVQMSSEFGATLGLAIYGTISAAVYRASLSLPAGLPANVTAAANDSLAGAAAAIAPLPHDTAAAVLGPARAAFAAGLHVVAVIGVVVVAVMAVVSAVRLRHVRPFGQADPDPR